MKINKNHLIKICSQGMANKCKEEMESQNKQWNFGNGFQTENTIPENWEKLFKTYPIKSKNNIFDLTSTYNTLKQEGFING